MTNRKSLGTASRIGTILAALAVCTTLASAGFVRDLADYVGGGTGLLPGTGGNGNITAPLTFTASGLAVIDGTFAPNTSAATPVTISTTGLTYDFSAQTSYGTVYGAWYNGAVGIDNPSNQAGLPNFAGEANFHSLLAGHATKGMTFDLNDVRAETGSPSFNLFTAYVGDSRLKPGGSISYYVLVDGALKARRDNITNSENLIAVPLAASDRFLTVVLTDARVSDINSDHSYLGDPFLRTGSLWTGGGADANWSSAANWAGSAAPVSGESTEVVLTGDVNVAAINQEIASPFVLNRLQVAGFNPDGSASALPLVSGGQAIQLQANGSFLPEIAISRNQQATINNTLDLAADTTVMVLDGPAAVDATLGGTITGTGKLIKTGPGRLELRPPTGADNAFTGGVTVAAGTVDLYGHNLGDSVTGKGTLEVQGGAVVNAYTHNVLGQAASATGIAPLFVNGGTFNADAYCHANQITMNAGTLGVRSGVSQADGMFMATTLEVLPKITTQANAATANISSKLTLGNDTTFEVADGGAAIDLQVSGQFAGGGKLIKSGVGTMAINSSGSPFTGSIEVNQGTLAFNGTANSTPIGTASGRTITINAGAALRAELGTHNPFSTGTNVPAVIINDGTMYTAQYQHSRNITMTGGSILSVGAEGGGSGLDMQGSPTVTINASAGGSTIASKITLTSETFFTVADGAAARDLTLSSPLAGGGQLTKNGPGLLYLSGSNAGWSGPLKVDTGTVQLGASEIIGNGTGLHNNWGGGGTFDLNGFNETIDRLGGNPTVTNTSATPSTLTINTGGAWDYGGLISGNLAIVKNGGNWQRFQRWNSYTGGTTVNGGTLYLRGSNNGQSTVGSGTLTINAGGTVVAENHNVLSAPSDAQMPHVVINGGTLQPAEYLHIKTVEMTGGTIAAGSSANGCGLDWQHGANTLTTRASASTATVAAKMTLSAPFTASVEDGPAATDLLISGQIVGGSSLTKTGPGTMVFTGSNSYGGLTTIAGGKLQIGDGGTGGTLPGSATNNALLSFNRSDTYTYGGQIGGNGAVTVDGNGTIVFTNTHSYTGGTTVNKGTLRLDSGNYSQCLASGSLVTVNTGAAVEINKVNLINGVQWLLQGGTWRMTGGVHQHVGPVTLSGGTLETADTAGADHAGNYVFDNDITVIGSAASTIRAKDGVHLGSATRRFTVADVVAGPDLLVEARLLSYNPGDNYGLIKDGPGTMVMSGASTYGGATLVQAGTLLVNGSYAGAGTFTVEPYAVLGGTGTISAPVIVEPLGRLGAGNSTGMFTVGNLTLRPDSFFDVEITPEGWDQLYVNGQVNLADAVLNLSAGSMAAVGGSTYVILNNDGSDSIQGFFRDLGEGASIEVGGNQFIITYQGGIGKNDIVLTSVPEPVTLSLLAMGAAGLGGYIRRRRTR